MQDHRAIRIKYENCIVEMCQQAEKLKKDDEDLKTLLSRRSEQPKHFFSYEAGAFWKNDGKEYFIKIEKQRTKIVKRRKQLRRLMDETLVNIMKYTEKVDQHFFNPIVKRQLTELNERMEDQADMNC